MYSFFNRLNFNQAQSEVAEAKKQSSSEPIKDRTTISKGLFDPESLRSVGISDKFFTSFKTSPTFINDYVTKLKSGPIDHTQTRAYQRAFKGYSTGTMFSAAVSRIGSLTSLFDSAIEDPFGANRKA